VRAKILLLAVGLLAAGCTRSWYRVDADRETYPIISERIVEPAYNIGRTRLDPAPTSRLFDPYDPDHPPKPPDDPAAAAYMARPGKFKGARGWEKDGVIDQIEPPNWEQFLGLDEKGVLQLSSDRAVEIALLNSREYQTALEQVYLTALGLTLNRYEFDLHWFARNATAFTHSGSGSVPTESNQLTINSEAGFTRKLAAGGQLLVDFANSIVLEYTGKDKVQVSSNIVVTLAQPLLRNAGRAVRLEALTQAERNVLYAVRDFAQFRKQFWANVAIQNGGYLDLLLAVQNLRNSRANLKLQEESYRLYNELFRGGRASVIELDQIFLSLKSAQQQVVDSEASLESALDRFKLRLGVPPRIPTELDAEPLNRFIVVDPSLEKLRDDVEAFQRDRLKELEQAPTVKELTKHFATLRGLADRAPAALDLAAADLAKWGRQLAEPARPDADADERDRAKSMYDGLKKLVPEIAAELKKATKAIDKHRAAITEATRKEAWEAITDDGKILLAQLDSVISMQTSARTYLIELPLVEFKEAEALTLARDNRLDLQNRLATVTDAWRQVRITANALMSDLNVVMSSNIGTDPDHNRPFNFAAEASKYTVGFQFDGPLNRLAERNAYRASLITYQQAKRSYMALSDQVEAQVRQDLRQLKRLQSGFENARQSLLSVARQFEFSRLALLGPREKRTANDTTTLNLLKALNDLLAARNLLASNYINFEQQRVQLLLDLEVLQLDSRGYPVHVDAQDRPATAAELSPARGGNAADDRSARVQPGTPGGS
jgi:outer membrane protein TolC